MAFSYGFFNAKNLDRVYTAEDFTEYLSSFICNGILDTYGDCFNITTNDDLSVTIGTGKAWMNGHYFVSDTAYKINLATYVDTSLARYVLVGIVCDISDDVRQCKIELKLGTASTTPTVPQFENTEDKTYLTLCSIKLNAGVTKITKADIQDYRDNSTKCGYVRCILGKCKVSEILDSLEKYNNQLTTVNNRLMEIENRLSEIEEATGTTGVVLVKAGQCGENAFYALYSDGRLVVKGDGATYEYANNTTPFLENESITSIVVDDGITRLGEGIFKNIPNLSTIDLPNNLREIGAMSLCYSTNTIGYTAGLTAVTIPNQVTTIEDFAFAHTRIEEIMIPSSVTSIGQYAFNDCCQLKTATIQGTVVGDFMFSGCEKLTSVTMSGNVESIGSCAFTYCENLESITYQGTTTKWMALPKGSNWDGLSGEYGQTKLTSIHCTDGDVMYNSTTKEWEVAE